MRPELAEFAVKRFPQRRQGAKEEVPGRRLGGLDLLIVLPLRLGAFAGNVSSVWKSALEVQLQSKLKLPGVESGRRTAEVSTILGPLVEQPDVIDKGRRRSFVEPIEQVEAFGD